MSDPAGSEPLARRSIGNFFARRARYPKFKPKRMSGNLRFQDLGAGWSDGILRLPKLGALKVAEKLPQIEKPDLITLSKDAAGRYFVSFSTEVESSLLPIVSKRREKQRLRVARLHEKIRNERQAAIHQLTSRLVREFDLIAIEHLNVKALARGMHARAVQDAAFGEIRRQLLYKGDAAGRVILEVSQWYPSSRTCSQCRHVIDELRLDERQWCCPKCGTHHDRDVNAARNILQESMREIAGCDDRDLRVDARDACFDDYEFIEQVLAEEARNGHRERACQEQASSR